MKLNKLICLLVFWVLLAGGCTARKLHSTHVEATKEGMALEAKAVGAYAAGEKEMSYELYQALVSMEPENHVALNNLGVLFLEAGKTDKAIESFESASLLQPDNIVYLANIGSAKVKLGEYDDALTFFDRVVQLSPGNSSGLYGKGVVYYYLDEPEAALGLFRQAVKSDPKNMDALFMTAFMEQKNGLWTDALNDFTKFILESKDVVQKANALSNRALCHFHLEEYTSGMTDIDEAMALNDNAIFYYNRAQGLEMLHEYEAAIKDYTRAISRNVSFPEAYINRGELHHLQGNELKGCRDLKRACDLGFCAPFEKYESVGKCTD